MKLGQDKSKKLTYQAAGVDIEAAHNTTMHLKKIIKRAQGPEVLRGIGAFGGLFQPDLQAFSEPVLVSSADGIGTKVMVAHAMKKYKNLGFDIVNHCVNDIMAMGARPLFFLDYLAFGKFSADIMTEIITGMVEACSESQCSLLGGETAEMPDLYRAGDFDIAGFIVGLVDKKKMIDGHSLEPDDTLIGIPSNGLHTNGYSLIRKIFFAQDYSRANEQFDQSDELLADALLRPHLSYFPLLDALLNQRLKGIAHITGGGIAGNLGRILPNGCDAVIEWGSWDIPSLFHYIQEQGMISDAEMRKVFNMGIGLILAVAQSAVDDIMAVVQANNLKGCLIGKITAGRAEVKFV
ncbi:phosphoribosylformylglycinamidine cyclo-ligase [candidate division CSSED10-310 bacterium]|uniref:Phosphoribosylformylglycinamidine cyclo-ligase n=1 Tax=candidate division CSSED10-310 bacterium TaxID=2855610 RepID=A0ABV6YRP3_UNCC1